MGTGRRSSTSAWQAALDSLVHSQQAVLHKNGILLIDLFLLDPRYAKPFRQMLGSLAARLDAMACFAACFSAMLECACLESNLGRKHGKLVRCRYLTCAVMDEAGGELIFLLISQPLSATLRSKTRQPDFTPHPH